MSEWVVSSRVNKPDQISIRLSSRVLSKRGAVLLATDILSHAWGVSREAALQALEQKETP